MQGKVHRSMEEAPGCNLCQMHEEQALQAPLLATQENSSSLEAAKRLTQSDQGTRKEDGAQCKSQYLHCQKQARKVYEGQRMQKKSYLGVEEEDTGVEGGQE
jgi:hypothetical protein